MDATEDNKGVDLTTREPGGLRKQYRDALDKSIEEAKNSELLITFTIEDFMAYTPSKDNS